MFTTSRCTDPISTLILHEMNSQLTQEKKKKITSKFEIQNVINHYSAERCKIMKKVTLHTKTNTAESITNSNFLIYKI